MDEQPVRVLNPPKAERVQFQRNFIKNAVCELRFPTIFDVDSDRPPPAFWKAIKREYPTHEVLKKLNVGAGSASSSRSHQFKSKKGRWAAVLRASALTLETTHYDSFEEFEGRLGFLVAAARDVIDSDLFTRIGLRYINFVRKRPPDLEGWINSDLVSPLLSGVYGDADEYAQQIRGATEDGAFLFQHGFATDDARAEKGYGLDFDFYKEEVDFDDAMKTIRKLHDMQHDLFRWTLGPKAVEYMQSPV